MEDSLILSHPFYKYADEVQFICKELLDHTPINYFCLARTYPNGDYGGLLTDKEWAYFYLKNDFQKIGFELQLIDLALKNSNFYFWNLTNITPINEEAQALYQAAIRFKRGSGVILIDPYPDYLGVCLFTTSYDVFSNDPYLVRNLPMLKRFILYFKEKIYQNETLHQAYLQTNKNKLRDHHPVHFEEEPKLQFIIKDYYLDGQFEGICFTQREAECLKYLAQGKTAKEIALLLKLSHRTIEDHVEKIKSKTHCKNLHELRKHLEKCTLLDGIE